MTTTEAAPRFYNGAVRTTWRLMGPRSRDLSIGMGLRFLASLFTAVPALVVIWAADGIRRGTLTGRDVWIGTAVIIVGVVGQYLFQYGSNYFAWVATFDAIGEARIRVLQHLQKLPMGSVAGSRTGDISAALTSDIEQVSTFAHYSLPLLFEGFAVPAIVFLALFTIDPPLALALAISVIAAAPLFLWANRALAGIVVERADLLATANTRMVEYIQGISVARAYNATGRRHALFSNAVSDIRGINDLATNKLVPIAMPALGIVRLGVPVTIAATSFWLFSGHIDLGTAVIFLVLVLQFYRPLIQAFIQFEPLRLADAALERIGRLMDIETQQFPTAAAHQPGDATIRFDKVTFGYEESVPVLTEVSFVAREGVTTAIVGPSGSGKSTILNLITRFWDPDTGTVSIGGVNVRDLTSEQLFNTVTTVFQDVYLFQGTIRDNIGFGRADATDEEIVVAARTARAHDFVMDLPDGYDTRIGEGGSTLSGGERQRISIARAILKDAPVILLDEATASMDPINEQAVQAGLVALVKGRTLIVVAHRLSTIKSADHIIVIDTPEGRGPGRIVQQGTHNQLVAKDGLYRHLWAERERASEWRIGEKATIDVAPL